MAHPGPISSSHRRTGVAADAEPAVATMNMGTLRDVLLVRVAGIADCAFTAALAGMVIVAMRQRGARRTA